MYPPAAAVQLRNQAVNAVAAKEQRELTGLSDDELLAAAFADRRVLVTENIKDFAALTRTTEHVGIIYCHPRRFPRDAKRIRRLVEALVSLSDDVPPGLGRDPVDWWLEVPERR
jgi:hypothetical protein